MTVQGYFLGVGQFPINRGPLFGALLKDTIDALTEASMFTEEDE